MALFSNFARSPWGEGEENETVNKKFNDNFSKFGKFKFNSFNNFGGKITVSILAIIFLLWIAYGLYEVREGEEAIVTRFGKFRRLVGPGLNYHLPSPIEEVIVEKTGMSRRIEIGYRSTGSGRNGPQTSQDISSESIMLTGDENIVSINVDVMWHIADLYMYAFNVSDPESTVKSVAESAIREVVGNTPINSVLSSQKREITERIEKLLQEILDSYQIGVKIEQVQLLKVEPPAQVIHAYRDVQTAKADKEKEINKAQAYNNDVIPKARGEAAKILQGAEAYRAEVKSRADGDAARFTYIYEQYAINKSLTRDRIYLETIENLLSKADNKFIITKNAVLPHMSLQAE